MVFLFFIVKKTLKPHHSPKRAITTKLPNIVSPLQTAQSEQNESNTEELFFRKRPYVVNKFDYEFFIIPARPCPSHVDLIILVHSEHSKADVRQAIRQTWGSMAQNRQKPSTWPQYGSLKLTYSLFFIFGMSKDPGLNDLASEENQLHGDIIQGNFFDSYRNMTLKSLLGLKFVSEFCISAKHMIKSDSDMFLNLPHITNYLSQNPLTRSIMGPICEGSQVLRTGKWGIEKEAYPFDVYPVYEAGSAYIISGDLCKEMLETSDYVPHIFIDDVYITGIIGRILNVTHVKKFGFAYLTTNNYKICDIHQQKIFTTTNLKPTDIQKIWKTLKNIKC